MANLAHIGTPASMAGGDFRLLGRGVYSLAEARRYASLPASTARSWFLGRADRSARGPVLASDFPRVGGDFAISFLDLIELYVAGRFRAFKVPMEAVRSAHAILTTELATTHPFAHSDLHVHGRRIIRRIAGEVDARVFYEVTTGQLFFRALESGLHRIDYVADLAARWRIGDGVIIDPGIAFGKPTVPDIGITTAVVAQQYWANWNDAALVADLFDLSEQEVRLAVSFEESFGRVA